MINICFSSDNNYAQHLGVTLASILANNNDKLHFYVLDGGISDENKSKILDMKKDYDFEIEFINIDKSKFEKCPEGRKNHVTLATYYRLLLAELCPNIDKILYLDVDLIVRSNLKELYDTDLTGKYFAGVNDVDNKVHTKRLNITNYCNAGVILINLKKWRDENITEKLFDWMDKNYEKIVLHDQDILNSALQEGILIIDEHWNVQVSKGESSKDFVKMLPHAKIIHYIGKHKPWHPNNKQVAKSEYFKYLKTTQWKNYINKYRLECIYKMPLSIIDQACKFVFTLRRINGQKTLQIMGLKFKISNR